jgi:ankyrin repeat protein
MLARMLRVQRGLAAAAATRTCSSLVPRLQSCRAFAVLPRSATAVHSGNATVVESLIAGGVAEPNATDCDGWTALLLAAVGGHTQMVGVLLRNGAIVDFRLDGEQTPLMLAAMNGHAAVVTMLVKEGNADVHLRGSDGTTSLMVAASNDRDDAVLALLDAGADIEAKDNRGESVLSHAARQKHQMMVALLMQRGAKLEDGNEYYGMRWANLKTEQALK